MQEARDNNARNLGFGRLGRAPDGGGGGAEARASRGEVRRLFWTGSHRVGMPAFTGTLYVDATGVADLYEAVKERVTLIWPRELMDHGQREFGVRDGNGYTIAFAEVVDVGEECRRAPWHGAWWGRVRRQRDESANVSDAREDERLRLVRELRQRLESLGRAGVDFLPAAGLRDAEEMTIAPALPVSEPPAEVAPTPPPPIQPAREAPAAVAPRPAPPPPALPPAAGLFGDLELETPVLPAAERPARLEALRREAAVCTRCPVLAATRTQTVFGVGSPTARLMFVGEAPGADEDRTGVPFVGRAGQLLTDMITKGMGLSRDDVYIANVLKSRPPENRNPLPDEVTNCLPYLERQIEIIRPEFLCLLGRVAASALLDTALPLGKLRGRWHRYRGIPAIVTYHPAYLLRNPAGKKEAWDDLQMLMKAMGITPPPRRRP